MNILIKLMSIVSLVIAPTLSGMFKDKIQENRIQKMGTMMSACKAAGCTDEQCSSVMNGGGSASVGSQGNDDCCAAGANSDCCKKDDKGVEVCDKTCGGQCDICKKEVQNTASTVITDTVKVGDSTAVQQMK
jgi:hypothetical protein